MRTIALVSVLVAGAIAVTGCDKKVTPKEAEHLLAQTYSNRTATAHFSCRQGERDWVAICEVSNEPTAIGLRESVRPTFYRRVGVRIKGTYRDAPVLAYQVLPDEGPVPSMAEASVLADKELTLRKAEADAYAAKVKERAGRVGQ